MIRIRRTSLSEAVEIFARLNSKGQAMTADQMVSALMYRRARSGIALTSLRKLTRLKISYPLRASEISIALLFFEAYSRISMRIFIEPTGHGLRASKGNAFA